MRSGSLNSSVLTQRSVIYGYDSEGEAAGAHPCRYAIGLCSRMSRTQPARTRLECQPAIARYAAHIARTDGPTGST